MITFRFAIVNIISLWLTLIVGGCIEVSNDAHEAVSYYVNIDSDIILPDLSLYEIANFNLEQYNKDVNYESSVNYRTSAYLGIVIDNNLLIYISRSHDTSDKYDGIIILKNDEAQHLELPTYNNTNVLDIAIEKCLFIWTENDWASVKFKSSITEKCKAKFIYSNEYSFYISSTVMSKEAIQELVAGKACIVLTKYQGEWNTVLIPKQLE